MQYILDGKTPVKVDDLFAWGKWFKNADRKVAVTRNDDVKVSTVFLGLDHAYDSSAPVLFETMIFGGEYSGDTWRYSTWEEAEAGHIKACELAIPENVK